MSLTYTVHTLAQAVTRARTPTHTHTNLQLKTPNSAIAFKKQWLECVLGALGVIVCDVLFMNRWSMMNRFLCNNALALVSRCMSKVVVAYVLGCSQMLK